MSVTGLLDLPDDLLLRCLAGAGGISIGSTGASCVRLRDLCRRLGQLPVFSSALSTQPSLQKAIQDAATRALSGCFGPVDFALLFAANYDTARGKKYSEPTDLAHAVDMLRDVLGQDVPIVGCACSGVMGVGPDSKPVEVDPACGTQVVRRVNASRKKQGLPALPTKGVSVLLGKLPSGCVVRAVAVEDGNICGSSDSTQVDWPSFMQALAPTATQEAQLLQHLAAARPHNAPSAASRTRPPASPPPAAEAASADPGASPLRQNEAAAGGSPAAAASPATAAAASQLLSVAASAGLLAPAAASASAGSGGDGGGGGVDGWRGDLQLVPIMCIMLQRSHAGTDEVLGCLASQDVMVVGGTSSGAGDLFYSPGAAHPSATDAPTPTHPDLVMMVFCTARVSSLCLPATTPAGPSAAGAGTGAGAGAGAGAGTGAGVNAGAGADQTASAAAVAAAGGSPSSAGPGTAPPAHTILHSRPALSAAAMSVAGIGPLEPCSTYVKVVAAVEPGSSDWYPGYSEVKLHLRSAQPIRPVNVEADAPGVAAGRAMAGSSTGDAPAGAAGPASTSAPAAAASKQSTQLQTRRSQRVAAATAAAAALGGGMHTLEHFVAELEAAALIVGFVGESELQDVYLAIWRCPAGKSPTHFNGVDKQQLLVARLHTMPSIIGAGSRRELEITLLIHPEDRVALSAAINPGLPGSVCIQVCMETNPGAADTLCEGLGQLLPILQRPPAACSSLSQPGAAAAAGAAGSSPGASLALGGCSAAGTTTSTPAAAAAAAANGLPAGTEDCYAALARCAATQGARSGLQLLAAFSCTGRGLHLFSQDVITSVDVYDDEALDTAAPAFGSMSEAVMIDQVCSGTVPFVGVYVDGEVGPDVQHMCLGWFKPGDAAYQPVTQAYTTQYAGLGCRPGRA